MKNAIEGPTLVAQWLRCCAPNAGGLGSIPGPGTRSHMLQLKYPLSSQINNNNNKIKKKRKMPLRKKSILNVDVSFSWFYFLWVFLFYLIFPS